MTMTNSRQGQSQDIETTLADFAYTETSVSVVSKNLRDRLFQRLTRKSANLFLRGRDLISAGPLVDGVHEPVVTSLIQHAAEHGHTDFLIDIGANIGLISCQVGNRFKHVHMFEPNPYCCNILEVNSVIALNSTRYHIHRFGLGDEDKKTVLNVPRHNWGGAFINDASNSYDATTLAKKDSFTSRRTPITSRWTSRSARQELFSHRSSLTWLARI